MSSKLALRKSGCCAMARQRSVAEKVSGSGAKAGRVRYFTENADSTTSEGDESLLRSAERPPALLHRPNSGTRPTLRETAFQRHSGAAGPPPSWVWYRARAIV